MILICCRFKEEFDGLYTWNALGRLYRGKGGNFYSFNLEKPFCTCDIYILRLISEEGIEKDTLVIPSSHVSTNTQISVGETKSKYQKYSKRWDYVEMYFEFMDSVG